MLIYFFIHLLFIYLYIGLKNVLYYKYFTALYGLNITQ